MKKEEKTYYEEIKDWDFSMFDIETVHFTNWDMYEVLKEITNENSKVLDLGTGGGEKVLEKFPQVAEVLGTDFSEEMIKTANKNLKESGKKNIKFQVMDNLNMTTPKEYFDVVVARNTVTDPKQIYETLKPGGYVLIHGVDQHDCHELKRIFGYGQAYTDTKPISVIDYENVLDAGFDDVELVPLHSHEYFKTKKDFLSFLLKVPILIEFSEEENDHVDYYLDSIDEEKLEKYIQRNTYPQGIRLIRRYYGIIGRKKY